MSTKNIYPIKYPAQNYKGLILASIQPQVIEILLRQMNVSSSNFHVNSGNPGNDDRYDCGGNGDFFIGDDNYDVGNDGDGGFGECVTFYPQQSRTICTHHISKSNISELLNDDVIQYNSKYIHRC